MKLESSTDIFSGQSMADAANGLEPAVEDSLAYGHLTDTLGMDPVQVAAAPGGGTLSGILMRALRRGRPPVNPPLQQAINPEAQRAVEQALRDMAAERTASAQARRVDQAAQEQGGMPPAPIAPGAPSPRATRGTSGEFNLQRHHPAAEAQAYPKLVELAHDNPAQILRQVRTAEEVGDLLDVIGRGLHEAPRTHEEVRAGLNWSDAYKAVTQEGLANDRQLFALRSIVATLGEKTALLARKIYQGDHTAEMLLQYKQAGQQLIALAEFTKGQSREVARALSQQNMIADVLGGSNLKALDEALKLGGTTAESLVRSATAFKTMLDKGIDPGKALNRAVRATTPLDAVIEFWKANLLSAPATHGANLGSGIIVSSAEAMARVPAALIGELRGALGAETGVGPGSYYSAQQLTSGLVGGMAGVLHSFRFFLDALVTGESKMGAFAGKEVTAGAVHEQFGRHIGLSPNLSEALITPGFRLMRATDEALMVPAYMARLSELAVREGEQLGLKGDDLARHLEMRLAEPTYEQHQAALEQGRKVVMQATSPEDAGVFTALGESVHNFANQHRLFHFVVPWIKTPARIMDYAVESSALAVASPRLWRQILAGGPESDVAAGKMVAGIALTAALYPLVENMQITGGGPPDQGQRAALEALGWKPYSFRVGDSYISYKNVADPVIALIAGVATSLERARMARLEPDAVREVVTGAALSANYMLEMSYLESMKRIFDAFSDSPARALPQFLGQTATGLVPYSSAIAALARSQNSAERRRSIETQPGWGGAGYVEDTLNIMKEEFRLRMPGLRDDMRPARYWDGTVKHAEVGELVSAMSPFKMGKIKDDTASLELVRHGVNVREPDAKIAVAPRVTINLLDFDNNRGEVYDGLIVEVGRMRRELVQEVIATPDYQNAEPDVKGLILDRVISRAGEAGTKKFIAERLFPMVEQGLVDLGKPAAEQGMTPDEFVRQLLNREAPVRGIVPKSRREIPITPDVRFQP